MGLRMERTRPVVDQPDSVTHWTCPARADGETHHIVGDMCEPCGVGVGTLWRRQQALVRTVRERAFDGDRVVPVWKITAWAPEPDGVLIYFEDEGWPQTYGRMVTSKPAIDLIRQAGLSENTI